jgi:hypothetical protein
MNKFLTCPGTKKLLKDVATDPFEHDGSVEPATIATFSEHSNTSMVEDLSVAARRLPNALFLSDND